MGIVWSPRPRAAARPDFPTRLPTGTQGHGTVSSVVFSSPPSFSSPRVSYLTWSSWVCSVPARWLDLLSCLTISCSTATRHPSEPTPATSIGFLFSSGSLRKSLAISPRGTSAQTETPRTTTSSGIITNTADRATVVRVSSSATSTWVVRYSGTSNRVCPSRSRPSSGTTLPSPCTLRTTRSSCSPCAVSRIVFYPRSVRSTASSSRSRTPFGTSRTSRRRSAPRRRSCVPRKRASGSSTTVSDKCS